MSTESRTQPVDRVLKALSPSLSAELDRILNEERQALEAEFETRLQTAIEAAVRDAETATRNAADALHQEELKRAIEEAREKTREETSETVRKEVTDDLQTQFSETLAETTKKLKSTHDEEFQRAQSDWTAEKDRLQQQGEQWRVFAEAQRQLNDASSQPEMLIRWLKLAEPFAASIAVYTAKADGLALWKSRGKAVFPEIISQQTTDPESFFKPVVVRDKTVAAVCALPPYKTEALDFLVTSMERAIEFFGLKLRAPARTT